MASSWYVGPASSLILAVCTILLERIMDVVTALGAEIEHVWKRAWLGYSLVAVAFCLFGWLNWHLPPSGYAVVGMAVVAGIMAIRPEMGGWERSLWFIVLVCFAIVEIRAINDDRAKQEGEFETVAGGLKAAISGLDTTISEGRKHFDATMTGLSGTLSTITGGESYTYLAFIPGQQGLFFIHKGEYPLYGVNARIVDIDHKPFNLGITVMVGDVIKGHGNSVEVPANFPMGDGKHLNLNVFFQARNGDWIQLLREVKVDGSWTRAIQVRGLFASLKREEIVCETIDKKFPLNSTGIIDKEFTVSKGIRLPSCQ